jgi:hypothetical protein
MHQIWHSTIVELTGVRGRGYLDGSIKKFPGFHNQSSVVWYESIITHPRIKAMLYDSQLRKVITMRVVSPKATGRR